jgi:hypothetical protein
MLSKRLKEEGVLKELFESTNSQEFLHTILQKAIGDRILFKTVHPSDVAIFIKDYYHNYLLEELKSNLSYNPRIKHKKAAETNAVIATYICEQMQAITNKEIARIYESLGSSCRWRGAYDLFKIKLEKDSAMAVALVSNPKVNRHMSRVLAKGIKKSWDNEIAGFDLQIAGMFYGIPILSFFMGLKAFDHLNMNGEGFDDIILMVGGLLVLITVMIAVRYLSGNEYINKFRGRYSDLALNNYLLNSATNILREREKQTPFHTFFYPNAPRDIFQLPTRPAVAIEVIEEKEKPKVQKRWQTSLANNAAPVVLSEKKEERKLSYLDDKGNIYYLLSNDSFFRFNAAELDAHKESIHSDKISLSKQVSNLLETSNKIGSVESKEAGIKYVGAGEPLSQTCKLKLKFKGNTYGSLRIGLQDRERTEAEANLLEGATSVYSPKVFYRK